MKTIAILGKPNVGKSSLFNRLIKQHLAITSNVSGTTRDVKKAYFEISGVGVELVDTGGIERAQGLFAKVSENSLKAGAEADLVLYMVDGSLLPQDDDIAYFRKIQRLNKPLILVVNKVDNDKIKQRAWDFSSFGATYMSFISVQHNRGLSLLLEEIFELLELANEQNLGAMLKSQIDDEDESLEAFLDTLDSKEQEQEECIAVGIIGRVNVGKSSLLNALLGKERSVVSEVAGTTIDPVDDESEILGQKVRFVDTAGIRRSSKILGIEKFALDRTNKALAQSHIAILVLDASEPFVELDEKISSLIPKHALGVIVVLNKWDKRHKEFKEIMAEFKHRFSFLSFAPVMTLSALNGRNIDKLKQEILKVYERFSYRIPTSVLNECVEKATNAHHIPSDHGKIVKIYYATQYATHPPQIALVSNRPQSLHFSYKRYIINVLREHFDFQGVPLLLSVRGKNNKAEVENENVESQKIGLAKQKDAKFGKKRDVKQAKNVKGAKKDSKDSKKDKEAKTTKSKNMRFV
ncbi:GTP-binding protein [Helicobacter cinaedi]|uniref:GTPase Der n=1 Tax=Helicobacter cinaedi TaxID=213 RepID=A0A377JTN8_9HELI|nr:ribosome biogenesis GTPase Der [Helicobacter cinaedi]STP11341.1 GTP-binding protein [Helicobacter cinaedi]